MNIPGYILALSHQLHTQDNRCTDNPVFQVRDVKQVPCLPEHADDTHWWDEEGSAVLDEELIKTLEDASLGGSYCTLEDDEDAPPYTYHCTHTKTLRQVVATFMTQQAADAWVKANEHRHNALEIYIDSGFRNPEWIAIRDFLMSLTPAPVSTSTAPE